MTPISANSKESPAEPWIATEATVTGCRYQFAGLGNLAFGFSTQKKFRIGFDYYAHGRRYCGEFQSAVAIAQNERIAITYNPLRPAENSRACGGGARLARSPLIAIGVAGSLLLSLLWLAMMRGCG